MHNCDMQKMIKRLHEEINLLLGEGSKEAYMRLNKLMESIRIILLQNDIGLNCINLFCYLWRLETVGGERTILDGVGSVEEAIRKYHNIRFAMLRLEHDLSVELCLEGIQYITDIQLSSSAFRHILSLTAEDSNKVMARISEITSTLYPEYVDKE